MAAGKPIITMTDVTKLYTVGGEEVRALDGASLTIREGEFVSIVGPSGSGKSTLMNIIGCLDVADSGEYILDGQSIEQYSEGELARIRNKKIGFVFQSFNLLSRMSALSNVELPLIYQRMRLTERREQAARALERVGLTDRSSHKPTELSGGQQQRVAIARAIATGPAILLADEPTGNLDSKTGEDILSLFHELHDAGNTIVLITHDEHIASQAQRRINIMDGRVSEVEA
jgi:putative ABC transport system ATP-binding protein